MAASMNGVHAASEKAERLRLSVEGAVQGVGFRPLIYRIAHEIGVGGWVINGAQGLVLEAEGTSSQLQTLRERLKREAPRHARIQTIRVESVTPTGEREFTIRESDECGPKTAFILPDLSVCPDCLRETFDPNNRRYLYPFTNCVQCGPRFSIMLALPYDRPNTTMSGFTMCEDCRREYENPLDRRFHAQPIACPVCGPQLTLWNDQGSVLAERHEALMRTVASLREGRIVAVKGLGGFHLMVNASDRAAVMRLRERKRREEKPFALMVPDLDSASRFCWINEFEAALMTSSASPITLLRRKADQIDEPAPPVAPGNPCLGVMLPYTPMHHILIREFGGALVATSGNLSDEPICVDETEALERLRGVADLFLIHNRPIARHVDDSVARELMGREYLLRRARGYAPFPIELDDVAPPLLATGAHQKNAIAVTAGRNVFLSQHIGDLETKASLQAFEEAAEALQTMYAVHPIAIARDLHPDYPSSRFAENSGAVTTSIQHHYAHVLACLADNRIPAPALGVAWDGTGFGLDGTVWGGEFLLVNNNGFERVAWYWPFALPGGEAAIRDIRRTALGALYETMGDDLFNHVDIMDRLGLSLSEVKLFSSLLRSGVNCPRTSSVGRLFDAVAALTGLRHRAAYEGQGAMELEWSIDGASADPSESGASDNLQPYSYIINQDESGAYIIDWRPIMLEILSDVRNGAETSMISRRFHQTLVEIIVSASRIVGEPQVALTGGCFQNAWLLCESVRRLQYEGFSPCWHRQVPANDGGIALGQIMGALREFGGKEALK